MAKFNQSLEILDICLGQFEIFVEDSGGKLDNKAYKELQQELADTCDLSSLLKLWEKASKMRVWLQNKKKLISLEIQDEANKKYEEIRIKKEEEAKKNNKEEDNKEEEEEETISTNKEETKEEHTTPIDNSILEEIQQNLELKNIKNCLKSIEEKAKFLLKIAIPSVWNQEDKSNDYLMLDPMSGKNELDMDIEGSSVGRKLKSIQRIQSSKGSVKTYEEIDSKDIFNSSGGSILAFLQCSISVKEVQEEMEERYINALNRYCGFKIINNLMK